MARISELQGENDDNDQVCNIVVSFSFILFHFLFFFSKQRWMILK